MKLYFEKLSRYPRINEYATVAVPFSKGEIFNHENLVVLGEDQKTKYPTQTSITAKWADGSIKWALIKFLADLPANKDINYFVEKETGKLGEFPNEVFITIDNDFYTIHNGCLTVVLNNKSAKHIFKSVTYKDVVYDSNHLKGFTVYNEFLEKYDLQIVDQWEVEEAGPVCASLTAKGKHYDQNGNEFLDCIIKLTFYAGKPYFNIDYKIINLSNEYKTCIKGIEFTYSPKETSSTARKALASSNYRTEINEGEDLHKLIDAETLLYTSNEHYAETFFGTFWADYCDKNGGVSFTIYQAQQNFPKAFDVNKNGIVAKIVPTESQNDLYLFKGMAKTHSMLIHFHDENETLQDINIRSLQYQMPDVPILEATTYEKSGVFENVFTQKKREDVESMLYKMADFRGRAYGMIHWGDAPDSGYTKQGRGNGKLVWTNNEYDFPHAMMLMFARSGQRRMIDYMKVAARHWVDVDVCHLSDEPERHGAQIIHSADHVSGYVEISHEWVEGLMDYYHQTGDQFVYNTFINIGENILYHLSLPKYHQSGEINARDTGWAMRALVALYKETNEEKYIEAAEKIVEHFRQWKLTFGAFLSPYTDHTVIRIPFMISIAVGSLMRFYEARPTEEIKNMIVEAVDDMVEHCLLDNGIFYYKELPTLKRLGNNTLVLEALVYAYRLTGNTQYLNIGVVNFKHILSVKSPSMNANKEIVGDAVLLGGEGPKGFAQSFYPITLFYTEAVAAGLL